MYFVCDLILNRVNNVVACFVGFIIPAILMVATGYVDCNAPLAVFLITTAIAFAGISFAGWAPNHLDLAPPYAGQNYDIHILGKNS